MPKNYPDIFHLKRRSSGYHTEVLWLIHMPTYFGKLIICKSHFNKKNFPFIAVICYAKSQFVKISRSMKRCDFLKLSQFGKIQMDTGIFAIETFYHY